MILESIRVRDYKNIKDSGEVDIRDGVTCLVGKNESGKTSLLEALYRLNPVTTGHPETFLALRDYPRRRYARDRERVSDTRPVTATFELEEVDVRAVEEVHGQGALASRRVTVSRSYDNQLHWEFECGRGSGQRRVSGGSARAPACGFPGRPGRRTAHRERPCDACTGRRGRLAVDGRAFRPP